MYTYKQNSNTSSRGSGDIFISLLQVALIVLKLTNVIAWSWLWVLAPLWMSVAIIVVLLGIVFILHVVTGK